MAAIHVAGSGSPRGRGGGQGRPYFQGGGCAGRLQFGQREESVHFDPERMKHLPKVPIFLAALLINLALYLAVPFMQAVMRQNALSQQKKTAGSGTSIGI